MRYKLVTGLGVAIGGLAALAYNLSRDLVATQEELLQTQVDRDDWQSRAEAELAGIVVYGKVYIPAGSRNSAMINCLVINPGGDIPETIGWAPGGTATGDPRIPDWIRAYFDQINAIDGLFEAKKAVQFMRGPDWNPAELTPIPDGIYSGDARLGSRDGNDWWDHREDLS